MGDTELAFVFPEAAPDTRSCQKMSKNDSP